MTTDLITGTRNGSTPHVTSAQQGAVNAYTLGPGAYILSGCEATLPSANTLHIASGYLMVQGRAVQVSATDLEIANGTQSAKRHDLACLSYSSSGNPVVETAPLEIVQGTPSANPIDPTVSGSILNGDASAQIPLWRVTLDGITPTVEKIASTISTLAAANSTLAAANSTVASGWTRQKIGDITRYTKIVDKTFGVSQAGAIYLSGIMTEVFPATVSRVVSVCVSLCDSNLDGWVVGSEAGTSGVKWRFGSWFQFGKNGPRTFSIVVEVVE